jgi:hypothetical protein
VPSEAGIRQPDVVATLALDIGDQQDFGMVWQQILFKYVNFQFAETAAKFDMALVREFLSAKTDHNVIVEGLLDFLKGSIIQLRGKIDVDFCAAGIA